MGSITKRRILKLKEMYSRMSLPDLADRVGHKHNVQGIRHVLEDMVRSLNQAKRPSAHDLQISSQSIRATLVPSPNSSTSIVTFLEDDLPENRAELIRQIKEANGMAAYLAENLKQAHREMGVAEPYLRKVSFVVIFSRLTVKLMIDSKRKLMLLLGSVQEQEQEVGRKQVDQEEKWRSLKL